MANMRRIKIWSCLLRMDSLWQLCSTHCLFTLKTILIGYHPQHYVNIQLSPWIHPQKVRSFFIGLVHLIPIAGLLSCDLHSRWQKNVPPKKLSFRLSFSLSDMTNYKSAFGKVCRIKNRHTFKSMPILNSAYFTECRRHIVIPCGKVCRIKNRHTFRILPILNSAYFKSMPILNSSYHAVKYAELRIGSILKVCRFVIRHITQTETQTETEANFTHQKNIYTSQNLVLITIVSTQW